MVWKWLGFGRKNETAGPVDAAPDGEVNGEIDDGVDDEPWQEPEPQELEIGDVLDLHTFPPREVKALVKDYLDLAHEKGLRKLRIIHGKGKGVQRRMVRSILDEDPRVSSYGDPPGHQGGWGATWVELESEEDGDGESGIEPKGPDS